MVFCDIQNNQGQGRGYQPKPYKAKADRDLDYSGYHKNWIHAISKFMEIESKKGN